MKNESVTAARGGDVERDSHVLLYQTVIPLRWGDMDAYGHTNNTAYFRCMEEIRIQWLNHARIALEPHGKTPVIVTTHCTFLRELVYPADIDLRMYARRPGRSSLDTSYEFRVAGVDEINAIGTATIVWVDRTIGKSIAIPGDVRAMLESLADGVTLS